MSLYGALYSGVSGLTAQSSAMGAIADNITNIGTTGYKTTNVKFNTLVTTQTALTTYSPGGVQSAPRQNVDQQGLLASTTSATDLGISGNGFFVVTDKANPEVGDLWSYSRSGSFKTDQDGYLKNSSGFYVQGWSLLPYDGEPNASTVKVGDFYYMKAYSDSEGNTTYINDNIVDNNNLKPINLSTIGGSATPTRNVLIGANLPAGAPVFDPANPEAGGKESSSTLIYDSLGNSHNVSVRYTKVGENAWDIDVDIPPGAANLTLYSQQENVIDTEDDVYAAYGQMEFNEIPANHSYIKITDDSGGLNPQTYVFEFSADGSNAYVPEPGEVLVTVDIQTAVNTVHDAMQRLNSAIQANMPEGGRFEVDNNRIVISQSLSGNQLTIDASASLECQQASANPNLTTGIPTGIYTIPSIDDELKNVGNINFTSTDPADYIGTSMILGNNIYEFTNGTLATTPGAITVDIATAIDANGVVNRESVVDALMTQLQLTAQEPDRYSGSGTSINITPTDTGDNILINVTGDNDILTFSNDTEAAYNGQSVTIGGQTYNFTNAPTGAANEVDISGVTTWGTDAAGNDVMALLLEQIKATNPVAANQIQVKGDTIVGNSNLIDASTVAGGTISTIAGIGAAVEGRVKDNGGNFVDLTEESIVLTNSFLFNGTPSAETGSNAVGVRFNSDGSPKYFNVKNFGIDWANGSENMSGLPEEGQRIELFLGNVNTNDGLTQLAGEFNAGYTDQDGAKFGSFAGVSITDEGLVVALFDNGDTRPIAQIPLATFVNPNGLGTLTGNAWIETDYSGQYTLRTAGSGGAGTISAASLENSVTDLGTEFTNMITTQRAYSAASQVITTSDEMLETLINMTR